MQQDSGCSSSALSCIFDVIQGRTLSTAGYPERRTALLHLTVTRLLTIGAGTAHWQAEPAALLCIQGSPLGASSAQGEIRVAGCKYKYWCVIIMSSMHDSHACMPGITQVLRVSAPYPTHGQRGNSNNLSMQRQAHGWMNGRIAHAASCRRLHRVPPHF